MKDWKRKKKVVRAFLQMHGLVSPHTVGYPDCAYPRCSQGGTWTTPKPYMSMTLAEKPRLVPGIRTHNLPSVVTLVNQ